MDVTNFNQLISWTRQVHQQLATLLEQDAHLHHNERARLLLACLSEQQQRLGDTIKKFEESTKTQALDAYIPYLYSAFEQLPINTQRLYTQSYAELTIAEISQVLFDAHQQMIDFYQHLVNESQVPEAKELVESLLALEQAAQKQMASHFEGIEDI